MNKSKKGFTIVELIIVIVILAVLAAVLIPTFSAIIRKANDSAYVQERTNKQLEDFSNKLDNLNFLTWEDFEAKLAEELGKLQTESGESGLTEAQVKTAIDKALEEYTGKLGTGETGLTEAQVKKIIEKALENQLTTAQVEAIVRAAIDKITVPSGNQSLTENQVKTIVEAAIAKLPKQTGITADEMKKAIEEAIAEVKTLIPAGDQTNYETISDLIKAQLDAALAGFNTVDEARIAEIIELAIKKATAVAKIGEEYYGTLKDAVAAAGESDVTIEIIKSFTLSETIGEIGTYTSPDYQIAIQTVTGGIRKAKLLDDVEITFEDCAALIIADDGQIDVNGHKLTLKGASPSSGLYNTLKITSGIELSASKAEIKTNVTGGKTGTRYKVYYSENNNTWENDFQNTASTPNFVVVGNTVEDQINDILYKYFGIEEYDIVDAVNNYVDENTWNTLNDEGKVLYVKKYLDNNNIEYTYIYD